MISDDMRNILILTVAVLCSAAPALALDSKILTQLKKLDPEERLEQRCDIEAMDRIAKQQKGFRPDKVIAYTLRDTVVDDNEIKAPGAVFRSSGEWYQLKYKCETGPERLTVTSFDYKVGAMVPRDKWSQYFLYD